MEAMEGFPEEVMWVDPEEQAGFKKKRIETGVPGKERSLGLGAK